MSALAEQQTTARRPAGPIGERVELARYTVTAGERLLVGQRVNSEAILVDMPAGEEGRVYLVERDLDQDGYSALKSLIADYVRRGEQLDAVPMSSPPVRRHLP
jgi:hypothetical protein